MSNETTIIIRHGQPGNLDALPYGTACKVVLGDKFELFVQANKHELEDPNWILIGTFDKDVGEFVVNDEINYVLGK